MFKIRTSKFRHVFCDQPKPEVSALGRLYGMLGSAPCLLTHRFTATTHVGMLDGLSSLHSHG
jgi:hypothetical protein